MFDNPWHDYDNIDGTDIRDFIHVTDLAKEFIAGLLLKTKIPISTFII